MSSVGRATYRPARPPDARIPVGSGLEGLDGVEACKRPIGQAAEARIGPEGGQVGHRNPSEGLRLVVADRHRTGRRQHQEPDIVVLVRILGRRIHKVDVQVDGRLHHPQPSDARLLDGLPERHTGEVGITVGVPAGLEPAPQLGVEQDQDPAVRRIHDQRRARQVPGATGPVEGVGPGVQEFQDPVLLRTDRSGLDGVPGIVDLSSGQVGS